MGDQEKMDALKDALDLARENGDPAAEAAALNGIGRFYFKDKVYEAALDFWTQCEEVCRKAGLKAEHVQALADLGDVHLAEGEHEKARSFFTEALEMAENLELLQAQARMLERLGSLEAGDGRVDNALEYYQKGLDICRRHEDGIGRIFFLEQTLPLLKIRGRAAEVEKAYREIITLAEKMGDQERMALGLVGLADLCERAGRPEEAVPLLQMAHDKYLRAGREREAGLVREEVARMEAKAGG